MNIELHKNFKNKFQQSFDESNSYIHNSNIQNNNKKKLYSGFYRKKNYYFKKNRVIKDEKYQKKQFIKRKTEDLNNILLKNQISIKETNLDIKNLGNDIKNEESNDNLTDESTLYQSQKSLNENSGILNKTISNSSIFNEENQINIFSKTVLQNLTKNINLNQKLINEKNKQLKNKKLNLQNKFNFSRLSKAKSIERYNKFNISYNNNSIENSKVFENTLILSVKIKINKNKYVIFNLRKYDDLIKNIKSFCEYNHIDKKLIKVLTIKIFEALNNIYRLNNYILSKREINYLFNINQIC
jgi:hypothetical protein